VFGISGIELMIILAVVLLIFGPEEMPRIGRIIGQGLRMFNEARQEVENVVTSEILRPEDAELLKDPLGMKSMGKELESTIRQMGDPNYKPMPKNAGMRVSTDDAAQGAKTEAPQEIIEEEVAVEQTAATPQEIRDVDKDDVASIWGVAPSAQSEEVAEVVEVVESEDVHAS